MPSFHLKLGLILRDINGRTSMDIDIPIISSSHAEAKYELLLETGVLGGSVSVSLLERPLYAP